MDFECVCESGYKEVVGGCDEICGDGINSGDLECDDGNVTTGDGCDSNCRIEENWNCIIASPDICYSSINDFEGP